MKAIVLVIILLCVLFGFDWLVNNKPFWSPEFWGVFDGLTHGLIAVLILTPLIPKTKRIKYVFVFFLIGSLIDIDHIIAAQSFSISDIIQLPQRPISHSLLFVLILSCTVWLILKNKTWGWIVFAGLASHILRDASTGVTPILYPLDIHQIPFWIYYLLEVLLLLGSIYISNNSKWKIS